MTIGLIILGIVAFGGGLVGLVVASVKRQARDALLREQAQKSQEVEHERVEKDVEIRNAPDDELAKRFDRWVPPDH